MNAQADSLAVQSSEVGVDVVDVRLGKTRWSAERQASWVTGPHGVLATTPGGLAFLVGEFGIDAVDLDNGRLAWHAGPAEGDSDAFDYSLDTTEVGTAGGLLFVLTEDGVRALDAESGARGWRWSSGDCNGDVHE